MIAVCEPPHATRAPEREARRTTAPARGAELASRVQELVVAASEGDKRAIGTLLEVLRPAIVRYCRARLSPRELALATADDVAQDVCIAVLRVLPTYVPSPGMLFVSFVYGIAAHKVADLRRAAARSRTVAVDEVPEVVDERRGPEELALSARQREKVARLLDTLSEAHREVLLLRVVLGLSAADTAAATGSTPGAIRVAQHRALSKLRAQIADDPAMAF